MEQVEKKKNRNSLIELYRFLFAMWVVYYHGYFFLQKSSYFSGGYIAVDFFFILTGLFVMGLIKKESEKPIFKGMLTVAWKKVKPLGVTLIIALIFAQIFFWLNLNDLGDPFGFMWYVEWLVIVPVMYYAIYKLVKNEKIFYPIIAAIVVVSYVLLNTVCIEWGFLRGTAGVGIGILLSLIPKIKLKFKSFDFSTVIVLLFFAGTVVAACFKGSIPNADHLFILFLFPGLLYFTTCSSFNFKAFNYLGSLSFGFYAYQTVLRVLEYFNVYNDHDNYVELFSILLALTIADDLVKRIVKFVIKKKKEKIEQKNSND